MMNFMYTWTLTLLLGMHVNMNGGLPSYVFRLRDEDGHIVEQTQVWFIPLIISFAFRFVFPFFFYTSFELVVFFFFF